MNKETLDKILINQEAERRRCLENILNSTDRNKIIIAGAGTGKTFTFKQVLKHGKGTNNLVLTFIRKLTEEMAVSFGELAETKTFHAYCKKLLHEQNGKVEIVPILSKIIGEDANYLGYDYSDFDNKFQLLEHNNPAIKFYLGRGDYYDAVSFNDSVYRILIQSKTNPKIIPEFDQILIDEFQDFNPLEVEFIYQLIERGPILVVGDDDQAIYDDRNSSPIHIRNLSKSKEFKSFELPFCGRCTKVIVDAINHFVKTALQFNYLKDRVDKKYVCYLPDKISDSDKYPLINVITCSTMAVVSKYVSKEIEKIDEEDIKESWKEGSEYPTVLIVGSKQYLNKIVKDIKDRYPNLKYKSPLEEDNETLFPYKLLLSNSDSNIAWRILAGLFLSLDIVREIVIKSEEGTRIIDLLDKDFVKQHLRILEIIRLILHDELDDESKRELKKLAGDNSNEIIKGFTKTENDEPEIDKTSPSILLTSFKGCKGLSAGHVFILGVNNDTIPRNINDINDVDISQFLVALTRTRKQCHIVSNEWMYSPQGQGYIPFTRSLFVDFLPKELLNDLGKKKSKELD